MCACRGASAEQETGRRGAGLQERDGRWMEKKQEREGGSDLEVKASRLLFFIRLFPAGFARVYFLICLEKQKHRVSHSCDVSYGRVVAGLADSVQWHHVRRLTFFGLLSPS